MTERLREWLRFDEARVPDVEEAYREYVRHSKPGVVVCVAFVLAVVSAVGIALALMLHGWSEARTLGPILVTVSGVFYGIMLFAVVRSPLPVLGRVLRGAASLPRVCVLAIGIGALCAVVEMALIVAIALAMHTIGVHGNGPVVDYFSEGVVVGLIVLTVAAPLIEEFVMQGWLQTRLARLGPFWAGLFTTIVFVLAHVPTSIIELVRGLGLGAAAWLRATTRSMLGCILVHATNNGVIALAILAARATSHK